MCKFPSKTFVVTESIPCGEKEYLNVLENSMFTDTYLYKSYRILVLSKFKCGKLRSETLILIESIPCGEKKSVKST